MTDRLTDAELDDIEGSSMLYVAPVTICALVAEVREHRAARTLTQRERADVDDLRNDAEMHDDDGERAIVAIIDRITEEERRG